MVALVPLRPTVLRMFDRAGSSGTVLPAKRRRTELLACGRAAVGIVVGWKRCPVTTGITTFTISG